jgi:hypothetical protein
MLPVRQGGSNRSEVEALDRKYSGLRVLERPLLTEKGVRVCPDARNDNVWYTLVNTLIRLFSHEEARATDQIVAQWGQFTQNAALGAHTYILEDGTELPKSLGPHAEEGGEVLEGMYAQGRTTIEESRIRGRSGRAWGQVSAAETGSGPTGTVSKDPRIVPTRLLYFPSKTFSGS